MIASRPTVRWKWSPSRALFRTADRRPCASSVACAETPEDRLESEICRRLQLASTDQRKRYSKCRWQCARTCPVGNPVQDFRHAATFDEYITALLLDQRRLLQRHFLNRQTFREIARQDGVSHQEIFRRYKQAIYRLKVWYAKHPRPTT